MKRFLIVLLALMMLLPAVATAEVKGYWNPPSMNEGQYPFGDGSITLDYWMPINAGAANFISSYDENPAVIKWQEDTGIDISFIHPTVSMEREQFNLMMSSGDLPDIILMPQEDYYDGGVKKMYEDGAIIDITPYLEQYAPQYKACVDYDEISKKQIYIGDNGEVFGFYRLTHTDALPYAYYYVHSDWLDEFGMEKPKTITEFEAYFDCVLANKPGVTPLYIDFTNPEHLYHFMGAFDLIADFFVKDGTVSHYSSAPEYKEFLELMNKWYEKGYISKDILTLDGNEVEALFLGRQLGMCLRSSVVTTTTVDGVEYEFEKVPYMRKEADSQLHCETPSVPVNTALPCVSVITTACENVEAAIAFLNYAYTYEGGLVANWGIEGSAWDWNDEGVPQHSEFYTNNPDGMTTSNVAYALRCHLFSKYTYSDLICGLVDEVQINHRKEFLYDNVDDDLYLPPVNLMAEELSRRTELLSGAGTFIDEMKFKFITGEDSLGNWDAYVETVNGMGMNEAVSIMQAAYDRF
jgi:putative aldouronate transport system substrate-binding protein